MSIRLRLTDVLLCVKLGVDIGVRSADLYALELKQLTYSCKLEAFFKKYRDRLVECFDSL